MFIQNMPPFFPLLEDKTMKPIDQNTMRFYEKVSIDYDFDGMGLGDEAERLSTLLGDNSVLLMGNHGVLTAADSVAQAFDDLFYFERACETLIEAYQTGKKLHLASHEVAKKLPSNGKDMTLQNFFLKS
jgi:ribulose-5-phosphate 4-epimerase/fuculose-1-phosphate aldolase